MVHLFTCGAAVEDVAPPSVYGPGMAASPILHAKQREISDVLTLRLIQLGTPRPSAFHEDSGVVAAHRPCLGMALPTLRQVIATARSQAPLARALLPHLLKGDCTGPLSVRRCGGPKEALTLRSTAASESFKRVEATLFRITESDDLKS